MIRRYLLIEKLKESIASVLPVVLIVFFTSLFIIPIDNGLMLAFLIGSILLIVGMAIFSLGSEMSMNQIGNHIGSRLTKTKKITLIVIVSFVLGFAITVAEPDLNVLASSVPSIDTKVLMIFVSLGVGLFLSIAMLRILYGIPIKYLLIFFYAILFIISIFVDKNFIAVAFDSGGVTTGPITVPFIMALGVGVASAIGGKNSSENSFGLIALCSVGPIIALMGLVLGAKGDLTYKLSEEAYSFEASLGANFLPTVGEVAKEVIVALGLIVAFFSLLQFVALKLSRQKLVQIGFGIVYTFVGLVIFLTAVTVGFMPVGFELGKELSAMPKVLIAAGFVVGMVVVLAEPAVHVLNKQVEEITGGLVTKRSMLIALSAGVGISIGLSMIRIIVGFPIIYYLIPGYFLSLGLSFFVPRLYTAIAFDSGGVASGPLTSSFILPLAIGACASIHGEEGILSYAFGIVAMVAMTPLISIQVLGFKAVASRFIRNRLMMRRIQDADDEQIIDFM